MSDAAKAQEQAPLVLSPVWRVPSEQGATIHPLRLVRPEAALPALREDPEFRAMVAEIVREELRSDLGRRMTRSIRGLVRDEVGRIFSRLDGR